MGKLTGSLWGRHYSLSWRSWRDLNQYIAGITNRCVGGRYVIFLDYDDVPGEWVEEELSFLQQAHNIGDFHLFRTKNGFHAICTDKLSLRSLLDVLRDSSTDDAYLYVSLRRARKVWTLRLTEKEGETPSYVKTIRGLLWRTQSAPHNHILRKIYNIKIPRLLEDGEKTFLASCYHISGR